MPEPADDARIAATARETLARAVRGLAAYHLDRPQEAAGCFRQARTLWRGLGDTRRVTGTWRKLGWVAAAQGNLDEAIRLYRRALRGYQEPGTGTARQAALTMIDLGTALTGAGRDGEAVTILHEAAQLLSGQPDPYNIARAEILETLAMVTARAGDRADARLRYQEALAILPTGHPRAGVIRGALAALPDPGGSR